MIHSSPRLLPVLLLTTVILPAPLTAASFEPDHTIREVLLYPDRAIITRTADLTLPAGEHEIAIKGLPHHLDEASVRARGTGKGLSILSVEVKRDYIEQIDSDETRQLLDQIEDLEAQVTDLNDERQVLDEKKRLLDQLSNKAGSVSQAGQPAIAVDDLQQLVTYYSEQTQAIAERKRIIERETADLREEIAKLRRQLNKIQNPGKPQTRNILVTVQAKSGGKATIQTDYLIHNAGWQPQYDVHASSTAETIELTTYGIIRQRTGEDWEDVKLTLSTARPSIGTTIPELDPWVLDFLSAAPAARKDYARSAQLGGEAKKEELRSNTFTERDQIAVEEEAPAPAQVITSTIETRGFNAVFVVPGTVTAPSDGEPHRCTASIQQMEADRSYLSIPKLSNRVFMKAKVTNGKGAPLLPGQLNTFVDNDFLGRSQLNLVAPQGSFEISLGPDDSIKVERTEKVRKEDTRGILSKDRETRLGYTIDLENFKDDPVAITVQDQIPVSRQGNITVRTPTISPKPTELNEETGIIEWTLTLEPRKKSTLEVDSIVTYPPGQPILGL